MIVPHASKLIGLALIWVVGFNLYFLFQAESLSWLTLRALITSVYVSGLTVVMALVLLGRRGGLEQIDYAKVVSGVMKIGAPVSVLIALFTYIEFKFLAADLIEMRIGELRETWAGTDYTLEEQAQGLANQTMFLSPFVQTTFTFLATVMTAFIITIFGAMVLKRPRS